MSVRIDQGFVVDFCDKWSVVMGQEILTTGH